MASGRRCPARGRLTSSALGHGGDGSNGGGSDVGQVNFVVNLGGDGGLLGAIARDVASLTTLIAGLAGSVERASVGSGAIAGDVAELAAGIALHGLSLAITGKVVGATALVAGSRARATSEAATATEVTGVAATAHGGTATHGSGTNGVRASTLRRISRMQAKQLAKNIQQDDRAGRSCSSDRRWRCRSGAE